MALPYVGVANEAVIGYGNVPARALTIENLTIFHLASRLFDGRRAVIVFADGMPFPIWELLTGASSPVVSVFAAQRDTLRFRRLNLSQGT